MWPGTDNLIRNIEQRFKNSSIDNMTGLAVTFSSLLLKSLTFCWDSSVSIATGYRLDRWG
jgi:hypothetical protein